MHLSFNVLLNELKYQYSFHLNKNENPEFQWVKLLTKKNPKPCASYLQVCLLSEALDLSLSKTGFYYLCLRDRIVDSLETEEKLKGMVIINENINLFELFNQVQEIFIKINNWIMQMQESIVKNKGIQYLIDLSEKILGNHISVLDPTFKLLAYTKNIECDDVVVKDLIRLGYHPEVMIKKLQLYRHIEFYKQSEEILVDETFNVSKYIALEKAFKFNNSYSVQVVMICCQRNYSEGLLDLFKIIINFIKVYVDKIYYPQGTYNIHSSLIYDLLEDIKLLKEKSVKERAKRVNIPYNSTFNFFKISFIDPSNIPLRRIMNEISGRLISSKVIIYEQNIISLNIYDHKNIDEHSNRNITKINDILKNHNAYCGISSYFDKLLELRTAYEQANIAIHFGKRFPSEMLFYHTPLKEKNNRIFEFEDFYIYYMLDRCIIDNSEIFEMSFCIQVLKKLQDYDQKHNLEYMEILFAYLLYERNASQTAKLLHMHRNNVIYHINKIKELTGIDLNDAELRFKLLISFKIFELNNATTKTFLNYL